MRYYCSFSMKRDLISMLDVKDDIEEIIALGIDLKTKVKKGQTTHLLKGKTLGMIFFRGKILGQHTVQFMRG